MLSYSLKYIDISKISFVVGGGALRIFGGLLLSAILILLMIGRTGIL
jgi:hypothetical protein